jgi:hypothetical protein
MPNDSSTGGYLSPAASPAPLEGQALNRFLQGIVVGITGLPGNMVRPRWQAEPPNIPAFGVDWAAIGIIDRKADTFASQIHSPTGNGSDTVYRQEILEVLCSFYGPDADQYASYLREGLSVSQNRETLQQNAFGLIDVGDVKTVPDFVKERWIYRVDVTIRFRRAIEYVYPVLNILSSGITLETDESSYNNIPITVSQ